MGSKRGRLWSASSAGCGTGYGLGSALRLAQALGVLEEVEEEGLYGEICSLREQLG